MLNKLLLVSLLGLSTFSYSQTVTSTSTESRCLNSGTVTVSIAGGTPSYSYALTGGPSGPSAPTYPVTIASSSPSGVFNSLVPGTYFIEVLDQNGTYLDTVTVAGTYAEPRFDLDSRDIQCGGASDGMIWATNVQDGRPAFQYEIITPVAQATGLQSSDTFRNLPPGTYEVRMYDSCGNFQTRTRSIIDNYIDVDIVSSNSDGRLSCDTAILFVRPRYGRTPYTLRVVDPTNSSNYIDSAIVLTESFTSTGFNLPIYYPGMSTSFPTTYQFEVTDACGNTDISTNRHNVFNNENIGVFCEGFSFSYGSSQFQNAVWGDSVWFEMSPDPQMLGRVGFAKSGSTAINFDTIPFGLYTYTITTLCDTLTGSFGQIKETFDSVEVNVIPESCSEGLARLQIRPFGRPDGTYHSTVYKGSTLIDSTRHSESGFLVSNIDSGLYTITMWNECEDTVVRTILVDTTAIITLTTETSPFCGGGGNLKAISTLSGASAFFRYYTLFDEMGNEIPGQQIRTTVDSAQWSNLAAGTYIVGVNYNSTASFCVPKTDTVVVEGYSFPTISAVQVACTGGNFAIQGQNVTGVGPFTYYLRDQATLSILRGPQTTDSFTNLVGSGPYNILVVDSCGNTANASANPYTPNVNLSIVNGQDCENQFLEAAIDTTLETVYSWTGPNGFTSSAKSISFNPVTPSDTGAYNLSANMLNGCLIILDTLNLEANEVTEAISTSPTTTCFGTAPLYDSVVSVMTATSPVGSEVGYWEIISAPTNAQWNMNDSTNNALRILTDSAGDYQCVWTIESDRGCISKDTATISTVCGAIAVPVDWISFEAERISNNVRLEWKVASQLNNRGFDILRSIDGINFEWIGFEQGDGTLAMTKTFEYTDVNAPISKLVYKLVQHDYDGNNSTILAVVGDASEKTTIALYPNPSSDIFNILLPSSMYTQLNVYTLDGVLCKTYDIAKLQELVLNISAEEFVNGAYIAEFSGRKNTAYKKLIISK